MAVVLSSITCLPLVKNIKYVAEMAKMVEPRDYKQ